MIDESMDKGGDEASATTLGVPFQAGLATTDRDDRRVTMNVILGILIYSLVLMKYDAGPPRQCRCHRRYLCLRTG